MPKIAIFGQNGHLAYSLRVKMGSSFFGQNRVKIGSFWPKLEDFGAGIKIRALRGSKLTPLAHVFWCIRLSTKLFSGLQEMPNNRLPRLARLRGASGSAGQRNGKNRLVVVFMVPCPVANRPDWCDGMGPLGALVIKKAI